MLQVNQVVSMENSGYSKCHMQIPTPILLKVRIRIFYSRRDSKNRSYICFLDVDKEDPKKILYNQTSPIVNLGPIGSFDEYGCMPSCAIQVGDEIWLYYIGWSRDYELPYRLAIGLIKSDLQGKIFHKHSIGPILDRGKSVPYFATTPFVRHTPEGFEMLLSIGKEWKEIDQHLEPRYELAISRSQNGIDWTSPELFMIGLENSEICIARPWILETENTKCILVSVRSTLDYHGGIGSYKTYRTDFTELSGDCQKLHPKLLEFEVHPGLNNEMTAYSASLVTDKHVHYFFNGNGFGNTGILFSSELKVRE